MAEQQSGSNSREDLPGLEQLLDRFGRACRTGTPPRIDEFLPAAASGEVPCQILEELIKVDLERRWSDGAAESSRPRFEDYVVRYPQLGARPPIDIIAEEYRVRQLW